MSDKFRTHAAGLTSPASGGMAVVPSDADELATWSRALYVGVGGSLAVELAEAPEGEVLVLQNVQAGMIYPLRARKVRATGTSAAALVAFW
ncbi:spike base protein, RCAP_Rcc01079 family [Mangrovicoccus ximenensis]|uniref:spike base protein, RCAP_Rcc01079 family n=1 Tax=Mangrovicoccus ximenensis TaxID=1911570 RepID=UPI000D3AA6F8|nr:hypothetical protein [Mangrovicoccus ximenensis]